MKDYGKVVEFDGYVGKIVDNNGKEFLLLKEELLTEEVLNKGDLVSFNPEKYEADEVQKNIARFVRVLKK